MMLFMKRFFILFNKFIPEHEQKNIQPNDSSKS